MTPPDRSPVRERDIVERFMSTEDAFKIVYALAEHHVLDVNTCESALVQTARRQQFALGVVHDFLVNNIYD